MSWDLILIAAIAAVPPTIAAIAGWRQAKETHVAVNSRMDAWLKTAVAEAAATAILKERAAEVVRKAEAILSKSGIDETILK